jgi:hypothetical protein
MEGTAHKEEAAAVVKFLLLILLMFIPLLAFSQVELNDELQVNLNTYFDNFSVNVIYPSINIVKSIDGNTRINGSYMVDAISSASMRMVFKVDGITSATPNNQGGVSHTPDELRHQLNFGFTRFISDVSLSVNGMYGFEHDYSSKTLVTNFSIPFAKKNTTVQLGFTRNWDKIFPVNRTWTKQRNTSTLDIGVTQILSKNIISQFEFSFIDADGYMLDGYQVVRLLIGQQVHFLEPVEPEKRIKKAAAVRTNYGISNSSTLKLGYRYYWDTWDIKSHTLEASFKTHLSDHLNLSLDFQQYFQTKAYFFKPVYNVIEPLMGVDSKLNSGYSSDISLSINLRGNKNVGLPIFNNEKLIFTASFGFFHRHTDSPDWSSRMLELYAYLINFGFKFSI